MGLDEELDLRSYEEDIDAGEDNSDIYDIRVWAKRSGWGRRVTGNTFMSRELLEDIVAHSGIFKTGIDERTRFQLLYRI